MRTVYTRQRQALVSMSLLTFLVLAFVLAACGASSGGSSTGGPGGTGAAGSSPTTAPTPVKGYGTANGCPSDMVVGTEPAKANVLIRPSDTNTTIPAHTGDVIEVRLPFGQKWAGPNASQGILELQSPAGYAWKADKVCIWRFVAKGTGSAQLSFTGRALCKPGQMCPMYIMEVPFKINVQ
jgi:hypothetical protein